MKISGFTIVRNAIKFNYPVVESIQSILPVCDEFIVNVGKSEDETLKLIQSIKSDKIRIIETVWDFAMGKEVLSFETNRALKECKGDWAFYLQSDELVHEDDLPKIVSAMENNFKNENVDALRFKWLHFYGSFYRYRIDRGWYQKQDRIIRNNGQIHSVGDAFGFARKDNLPLRVVPTGAFIYHYGWVNDAALINARNQNAQQIGYADNKKDNFSVQGLEKFHPYFGSHPAVMEKIISSHEISHQDKKNIQRQFWWHPGQIFNLRYKTGKRVKESIL